jgi:mRNA interferase MazF
MSKYSKGDIVIIRFPFTDLTSSKKRPALVISNDIVNQTGDYLMVQITSKEKKDSLSLPIAKTDYTGNKALPLDSFIRLHKIFLLHESLVDGKAASINKNFLDRVTEEVVKLIE